MFDSLTVNLANWCIFFVHNFSFTAYLQEKNVEKNKTYLNTWKVVIVIIVMKGENVSEKDQEVMKKFEIAVQLVKSLPQSGMSFIFELFDIEFII